MTRKLRYSPPRREEWPAEQAHDRSAVLLRIDEEFSESGAVRLALGVTVRPVSVHLTGLAAALARPGVGSAAWTVGFGTAQISVEVGPGQVLEHTGDVLPQTVRYRSRTSTGRKLTAGLAPELEGGTTDEKVAMRVGSLGVESGRESETEVALEAVEPVCRCYDSKSNPRWHCKHLVVPGQLHEYLTVSVKLRVACSWPTDRPAGSIEVTLKNSVIRDSRDRAPSAARRFLAEHEIRNSRLVGWQVRVEFQEDAPRATL